MVFRKKKEENLLSTDSANQMLQNIFDACGEEPNTVPLEALESYSHYRRDRFSLQKTAIIIIIIIFLLIPVMFISPSTSMSTQKAEDGSTVYRLSVNSILPITNVSAKVGNKQVPVYETSEGVYSIEPDSNGDMVVTTTLLNKQYSSIHTEVTDVGKDNDTPEVVSSDITGTSIVLKLEDKDSGIDYEGIYTKDRQNNNIQPEINEKEGTITFTDLDSDLNVYVPDKQGNTLHIVLTVK